MQRNKIDCGVFCARFSNIFLYIIQYFVVLFSLHTILHFGRNMKSIILRYVHCIVQYMHKVCLCLVV